MNCRKRKLLTSITGKERCAKLLSPELPNNSRLLIETVRGMRSGVLSIALRVIY